MGCCFIHGALCEGELIKDEMDEDVVVSAGSPGVSIMSYSAT